MACTYYGGTTGQFTLDMARIGLVPFNGGGFGENTYAFAGKRSPLRLWGDGERVVLGNSYELVSPTMTLDLDGLDRADFSAHMVIDTDYLVRCKLLDQAVFEHELKVSPSPLAMVAAIRAAKDSIKPDYARTRKYGAGLADAIEGLLYHDLDGPEKDPNNGHWDVVYRNKTTYVGFGFLGNEAICMSCSTRNGIASKACNNPNGFHSGINFQYLADMGLIDLDVYQIMENMQPKPLALQSALRLKLGIHSPNTDMLDLPADTFDAQ